MKKLLLCSKVLLKIKYEFSANSFRKYKKWGKSL